MRTASIGGFLLVAAGLLASGAEASLTYRLVTAPGSISGGTVTGLIMIPEAFAGNTVFDIANASEVQFETSLGGGVSWNLSHLAGGKHGDVGFDVGIGADVLTPVADGDLGYPDWSFHLPGETPKGLTLGVDAEPKSIWQVFEFSSSGTNVFAHVQAHAGVIALWGCAPRVRTVLRICGLETPLNVCETETEARQRLTPPQ